MDTESHAFIIPHIHIGVDTHILMQIYPVVILIEMKFTECNNRFCRNQRKSQSVSFPASSNQRTGIDTKQYTGFSFSILIFCYQFGITVTNLSCQNRSERELGILRSVNDSGTQVHAGGILLDREEDSIQLQGIHFQGVNGCFSIDSPIGGCAKFHGGIMERYIFHCHIICQRILLPCRERENGGRQCLTQSSMIQ